MDNYELDLAWYYTAPGLAWDALLKITKAELELITDPDMLLMIEKGIRATPQYSYHTWAGYITETSYQRVRVDV